MNRRHFLAATTALAGAHLFGPAHAQSGATLSFIVPFPAGGISDVFARTLSPTLGKLLQKTLVVENLPGASGGIAGAKLLGRGAAADALFLGSPTELIMAPATLPAVRYKPSDFTLVALISRTPLAIYVRAELPVKTVDELVLLARAQTDKPLSYGSVGVGSVFHLAGESFAEAAGARLTHVPYRGGMPMLQDLMGGMIDMAVFPADGNVAKLAASGRMRPLAIAGAAVSPAFPGVPTWADSRLLSDWSTVDVWAGVLVPAATPPAVVSALHAACASALADPDTHKQLVTAAGTALQPPMSLAQLAEFYAVETRRYTTAIKRAKLGTS